MFQSTMGGLAANAVGAAALAVRPPTLSDTQVAGA